MIVVVGGTTVVVPDETVYYEGPTVSPLQWTWDSWTGEQWNLTSPSGPVTKRKGADGLDMPPVAHIVDEFPLLDGATWQSARIPPRSMLLPVEVHAYDSQAMATERRRFLRTLNPRQTNTLTITSFGGVTRSIDVRYVDGANAPVMLDPQMAHRVVYGLVLVANQPFWRGDDVSRQFRAATSQFYFKQPPLRINRAHTVGAATMDNPGDVAAWPVWTAQGPFDDFTVGVGSSLVVFDQPRSSGQSVIIDTRPGQRSITSGETGANLLSAVTSAKFEAIDPGTAVPITVDVTGGGTGTEIDCTITPLYWAGW